MPDRRPDLAAILIDYENLCRLLSHRRTGRSTAESVSAIVDGLRRHLTDDCHAQPVRALAYADFGTVEGGLQTQQRLCGQDVEPRFVPSSQPNAAELQLCIDAAEMIHLRPDLQMVVVLTGDRAYLPLLQQLRRYGRRVLLVALEAPAALAAHHRDLFLDAAALLDASAPPPAPTHAPGDSAEPLPPGPGLLTEIDDPILLQTIEIIEEYFGQYDEVYLTPLLRKLSEILDEQEHDPKTLVSDLEKTGAVRLEKRRGFPYDYTVLIVENGHPDVRRIQQAFDERVAAGDDVADAYDDSYDDSYDDDLYDDDYDDGYADEGGDTYEADALAQVAGENGAEHDDYDEQDWDERVR